MLARQIALGFGIAVVLPLLVYYAVASIYSAPKWRDFDTFQSLPPSATTPERNEFAEKQRAERRAYEAAAKGFARTHIIVAAPVGIVAILIGAYVAAHTIGTGLILGGIATAAWGYYSYWDYLDDWIRFVSLLVTFVILLVVAQTRLPQSNV